MKDEWNLPKGWLNRSLKGKTRLIEAMKPTYETKSPAYRRIMGFEPCSKSFSKSFKKLMESLK